MTRGRLGAALVAVLLLPTVSRSQQQQMPDQLRQRYRTELLVLRDSVQAVAAAAGAFMRDLPAAGPETVLARALALAERCRSAQRALRNGEGVLATSEPYAGRATTSYLQAAQRLRAVLRDDCESVFAPPGGAVADTVRAWGGYRTTRIDRAVSEYEAAAQRFGASVGARIEPRIPR